MSRFKNALCLELRPDVAESSWHHRCHRRVGHDGRHRASGYQDGKVVEWTDGGPVIFVCVRRKK